MLKHGASDMPDTHNLMSEEARHGHDSPAHAAHRPTEQHQLSQSCGPGTDTASLPSGHELRTAPTTLPTTKAKAYKKMANHFPWTGFRCPGSNRDTSHPEEGATECMQNVRPDALRKCQ